MDPPPYTEPQRERRSGAMPRASHPYWAGNTALLDALRECGVTEPSCDPEETCQHARNAIRNDASLQPKLGGLLRW